MNMKERAILMCRHGISYHHAAACLNDEFKPNPPLNWHSVKLMVNEPGWASNLPRSADLAEYDDGRKSA